MSHSLVARHGRSRVHGLNEGRAPRWRRALSASAAVALIAGVGFGGPTAQAAPGDPVSSALGKFLGGSALGLDLDTLVGFAPATA